METIAPVRTASAMPPSSHDPMVRAGCAARYCASGESAETFIMGDGQRRKAKGKRAWCWCWCWGVLHRTADSRSIGASFRGLARRPPS